MSPKSRTIKVDTLARVEGEGALHLKIRQDEVLEARLEIFEPPRFFEALLRGRELSEAPDITSRICGICPVAYQISAVRAMEAALQLQPDESIDRLRRLLYCGEWIESHALHVFLLHAPDFLGLAGFAEMAAEHGELVKQGLAIKRAGNRLVTVLGGREVHPINVRVGGFYRAPDRSAMTEVAQELAAVREAAVNAVHFCAGLNFPELQHDYHFVSLQQPDEYPIHRGELVSSAGLRAPVAEFNQHFQEQQVAHSNALQARMADGQHYLVGPMARYNLNFEFLPEELQALARELGFAPPLTNPFKSIVVRAIEIVYAIDEALHLLAQYQPVEPAWMDFQARAGLGHGASEAPRGTLYHRYQIDDQGLIQQAQIVPPTSQNQARIEEDLRLFAQAHLALPDEDLKWRCEQLIRSYDPCISCATHFLQLHVDRD